MYEISVLGRRKERETPMEYAKVDDEPETPRKTSSKGKSVEKTGKMFCYLVWIKLKYVASI